MSVKITILFLLVMTGWRLTAIAQSLPSPIKGLQRSLQASKDSLTSRVKVGQPQHTGNTKPAATEDSTQPGKHRLPSLAETDTLPEDRGSLVASLDHGSCKGVNFIPGPQSFDDVRVTPEPARKPTQKEEPAPHVPFLQVHGNVMYNLNYYSRVDTPYSERDIYQHTIQTWLDIVVKGEYPVRIFLTNHFSNSKMFRNFSDYNFSYNNAGFNQRVRDQLRNAFLRSLPSQKTLDSLQQLLQSKLDKWKSLQGGMKNPAIIQHMVEARELAMRKIGTPGAHAVPGSSGAPGAAGSDTTNKADSLRNTAVAEVNELDSIYSYRKKEADSLAREIAKLEQLLQTWKQRSASQVNQALQDIQRLDNPAQLQKQMHALGVSDSSLPKGYKTLMAVRSFSLGRTVVNYSELSAKNISVNGVQAEYNPSGYYAFASGSVDYRFRDFIVQGPGQAKQYLNVFRVGRGLKDGNSVILTYFTGRRQLFNAATTDTVHTQVPSSSLMGLTLEGNYHLTKNIVFTGEIAKSSSPSYPGDSTGKRSGGHLFSLGDHSNEAWSLKLNAYIPETETRIRGTYKHLSANYQSFSIFTDGSAQSAWSANIDQLLWKRQLEIVLGANTNDFSNPFISQEYKSTTVFKSIQTTLRRRSWPVISLGYFPSSQITKLGNSQYIENLFYTFTGNVTHSYRYKQLMMNTTAVYTQFYNKSSDSGFTYFNTKNLLLSQSIFLGKTTVIANATLASNTDYKLYGMEGKLQQQVNKILTLGAGVKYNKQTFFNLEQWGYSAEAMLNIPRLGQIQFSADKGYVPGMNKQLVPDNTGRLTYFKTF